MTNNQLRDWAEEYIKPGWDDIENSVARAVLRLLKKVDGVCKWKPFTTKYSTTSCGWTAKPYENGKFCKYCGKRIKEVKGAQ